MYRKRAPRLAAAFVVTVSAGCGGSATPPPEKPEPDYVPNLGSVKEGFMRLDDGTCVIQHAANPPWQEPADCETQQPLKKPDAEEKKPEAETPPVPTTAFKPGPAAVPKDLPEAPAGWRIEYISDGTCTAYPSTECPRGARCNPPPPMDVKCP